MLGPLGNSQHCNCATRWFFTARSTRKPSITRTAAFQGFQERFHSDCLLLKSIELGALEINDKEEDKDLGHRNQKFGSGVWIFWRI